MILVVGSTHDIPTILSTQAALRCQTLADAAELPNELLLAFAANRFLLELEFGKPVELMCYYGHGTESSLVGNEILTADLLSAENAGLLQNKILYAFACQAGNKLAPALIQAGARTVFASIDYMFGAFPEEDHNYFEDWLDTILIIPRTLFNYGTAGEAIQNFKNLCTTYIDKYKKNPDAYLNGDWYAEAFERNREGLMLFGDKSARLDAVAPKGTAPFTDVIRSFGHALNQFLPLDTTSKKEG